MRISDIIESPIADISVMGDIDQTTSFGKSDKAIIKSPKARAKLIRAFENTPFTFEIIFFPHNELDGDDPAANDSIDDIAGSSGAGVHQEFNGVKGKAGVIRLVLLSNLSPPEAKMPLTFWTIAHKIGHALQDHYQNRTSDPALQERVMRVNAWLLRAIGWLNPSENARKDAHLGDTLQGLIPRMTMKSAREDKLVTDFEIFPELTAQYLIKGKITLRDVDDITVDQINKAFSGLFTYLKGKVLVEL